MQNRNLWRGVIGGAFLVSVAAMAYHGAKGQDGRDAVIQADGSAQQYDLSGGNGGYGSNGYSGQSASCYSTGGSANVHQPSGGNGQDGGNGGAGGDGGNLTVYYTDIENVKRIYVRDTPGYGGRGGYGGQGGSGCRCSQHSWTIPNPDPNLPGQSYYCMDGRDGIDGSNGRSGARGNYGHIYLVPGTEAVKPSTPSLYLDMAKMTVAPVAISQNNWEIKAGARALFAPGSDLRDGYYHFRDRNEAEVTFVWAADRPVTQFKGYQMLVHFVGSDVKIDFPQGILIESETKNENGKIIFTILSALKSTEVANLQWGALKGHTAGLTIGVKDKSQVSHHVDSDVALTFYSWEKGKYQVRFKDVVPDTALKVTPEGFEIALGQLGMKEEYLQRGTPIYIELLVTRTAGGVAKKVRLAQYFKIAPMAVGDSVEIVKDSDLYSGTTVVGHVAKGETYQIKAIQGQWILLAKVDGTALSGWIKLAEIKIIN